MTTSLPFRPLAAVLWTVVLAALLLGLDRALMPPSRPVGWVEAESLDDVPDSARPLVVPTYLPDVLGWPPARVTYRLDEASPRFWLGLAPPGGGEVGLWLGTLGPTADAIVGDLWPCLERTEPTCPPGWDVRVLTVPGVGPIVVLGLLPTDQLDLIASGLRAGGGP